MPISYRRAMLMQILVQEGQVVEYNCLSWVYIEASVRVILQWLDIIILVSRKKKREAFLIGAKRDVAWKSRSYSRRASSLTGSSSVRPLLFSHPRLTQDIISTGTLSALQLEGMFGFRRSCWR